MSGEEQIRDKAQENQAQVAEKVLEIPGLPDRFKLLEKLGAGGMAVVYLALDKESGEQIALKNSNERSQMNTKPPSSVSKESFCYSPLYLIPIS